MGIAPQLKLKQLGVVAERIYREDQWQRRSKYTERES